MFRTEFYKSLDSTNVLIESRKHESEGLVIVAEHQTNGKGQGNNNWVSETGGLYFSILLKPAKLLPVLSIMTGLVIIKTLEKYNIDNLKIKWPNDILYGKSKISGILIESKIKQNQPEYVIVGCGININQNVFEGVKEYNPVSLKLISGKTYDLTDILNTFLEIFENYYTGYLSDSSDLFINECTNKLFMKNEIVNISTFNSQIITAEIIGINKDGGLIINNQDGRKVIYSGRIIKNLST